VCSSDWFDPSQSRAGKLGLGIMRERAAAIGGRLHVESKPREGTVVTLEWPERTGVREDG
jgi:signal transduction histidine kinase